MNLKHSLKRLLKTFGSEEELQEAPAVAELLTFRREQPV